MKKSLLLIMIALMLLVFVSCDQQTEIEKIDCWNCGVSISKEAAFCEHCGVAIKGKENQTDDSTTADTDDKTDNTNDSTDIQGSTNTQEPHTHSYSKSVTAPTCTEKGYTTYTCSCGDSYTEDIIPMDFTITSDNKTLVGYTGQSNENLIIPAVFSNEDTWYKVVSIDNSAFIDCNNLVSVVIPETVTNIGQSAFANCKRLTTVNIPNGVTTIKMATFAACDELVNVTIPNSVISIGPSAFGVCFKMTSITVPSSVTHLDLTAFYWCSALSTINFEGTKAQWISMLKENSWEGIGKCAIYCQDGNICIEHTEVVDNAVTATCIATGLTEGRHCSVCKTIFVAQRETPITDHTDGQWIVDKDATKTEEGKCHMNCLVCGQPFKEQILHKASQGLKFTLNYDGTYSLTGIGSCSDSDIIIPQTYNYSFVTSIDFGAFRDCTSIQSIVMPDSITTIDFYAFAGCTNLTSVTFSENLKTIASFAFQNCSKLNNVSLPNKLEGISNYVFDGCSSLTNISISNSITYIAIEAFKGCNALKNITIPSSVKTIGEMAFNSCTSLANIYYEGTLVQWCNITKGYAWDSNTGAYNLYCTDAVVLPSGEILKQ